MKRLLIAEYLKTRRRYVLVCSFCIIALQIAWMLAGDYDEEALRDGWMMFLYQLPLINAIFVPLFCAVVASRLCDIEHKGLMLKQLCVCAPKGALYDAKLLYGAAHVVLALCVQFAAVYVFGIISGFAGEFPIRLYALYALFTIVVSLGTYLLQHILSLLIKNQTIPFIVGAAGTFIGLFSMFLPQLPWLRKLFIWGYYGVFMFIGNDWDSVTRTNHFYYMEIDWLAFAVLLAALVLLYWIGRTLFCKKEV